jgi:gephyrin
MENAAHEYPLIPVEEALTQVLAHAAPLPPVTLPSGEALGHFLAADVIAPEPLPPFRASIVDGYAVHAADGPGDYPVLGHITAGRLPTIAIRPGATAYITTGAPVPDGADAVVMVEDSIRLSDGDQPTVRLTRGVAPGVNVRPVGFDVTQGQIVLTAGERLGPAEIGLLATVGAARVAAHPRPIVGVLSTGDELVEPGTPPAPGQIRDSNRPMLMAAAAAVGGVPLDLGVAPDVRAAIEERLHRGLAESDILLTSGGVSVGGLDLIKPLLEETAHVHFGRLLMKPGKPCTFATAEVNGRLRLIFGLPGNPVSSLATFYLLVEPAIRRLAGRGDPTNRRVHAVLAQELVLDVDRPEYHRATLRWDAALNHGHGGFVAVSTGRQASSRLLSMRSANALLELPTGRAPLPEGAVVSALLIGEV